MNWTSGRLQRHSKANANTQLKGQKGFLARAKRRALANDPACLPSALSLFNSRPSSRQPCWATQEQPSRQGVPEAGKSQYPSTVVVAGSSPTPDHIATGTKTGGAFTQDSDRTDGGCKGPAIDSIDTVKRKLLEIPDWARLSPTKPLRMSFASAQEMERFGRRKAVSAERRKGQSLPCTHRQAAHRIRHLANSIQPDDCSIRIGPGIHKTQTSLKSMPQSMRPSLAPSQSSESMLLDRFDGGTQKKGEVKTDHKLPVLLEHGRGDYDHARNTVPLDQVRDLKSWDEVLERSSSRSLNAATVPSSTPLMEPQNVSTRVAAPSSFVLSPYRMYDVNSESISHGARGNTDTIKAGVRKCINATTNGVGCDERYEPGPHSTNRGQHSFTLEKQVAMEDEFMKKIDYSLRSSSNMRHLPAPKTYCVDFKTGTGRVHPGSTTDRFGRSDVHRDSPLFVEHSVFYMDTSQHSGRGSKSYNSIPNRLADENDEWMRAVFPKDFENIQNKFSFRKPLRAWNQQQSNCIPERHCLVKEGTALEQSSEKPEKMPLSNANSPPSFFSRTWQSNENGQLESTVGGAASSFPRHFNPITGAYVGTTSEDSITETAKRIHVPQNETPMQGTARLALKRTADQAFPEGEEEVFSPQYRRRIPLQRAYPSSSIAKPPVHLPSLAQQAFMDNQNEIPQHTPSHPAASETIGGGSYLQSPPLPRECGSLFNDFRMLRTP